MVTLQGKGYKKIDYALSDIIYERNEGRYVVKMPLLACNSKKDAKYMQNKINAFVTELSNTVSNNI